MLEMVSEPCSPRSTTKQNCRFSVLLKVLEKAELGIPVPIFKGLANPIFNLGVHAVRNVTFSIKKYENIGTETDRSSENYTNSDLSLYIETCSIFSNEYKVLTKQLLKRWKIRLGDTQAASFLEIKIPSDMYFQSWVESSCTRTKRWRLKATAFVAYPLCIIFIALYTWFFLIPHWLKVQFFWAAFCMNSCCWSGHARAVIWHVYWLSFPWYRFEHCLAY